MFLLVQKVFQIKNTNYIKKVVEKYFNFYKEHLQISFISNKRSISNSKTRYFQKSISNNTNYFQKVFQINDVIIYFLNKSKYFQKSKARVQ